MDADLRLFGRAAAPGGGGIPWSYKILGSQGPPGQGYQLAVEATDYARAQVANFSLEQLLDDLVGGRRHLPVWEGGGGSSLWEPRPLSAQHNRRCPLQQEKEGTRPQPETMLAWLREAFDGKKVQALPAESGVVLLAPFQHKVEDEVVLVNIRLPPPTAKGMAISGEGVRWVAAGAQRACFAERGRLFFWRLAKEERCALLQTSPRPC